MNSHLQPRKGEFLWKSASLLCLLALTLGALAPRQAKAATNVAVWDTGSPLAETPNPEDRAGWKRVPSDLLALEKDPAKASSDPGYYGREYAFQGDAVVENSTLTAVFQAAKGRVILYAATRSSGSAESRGSGRKIAEIAPLGAGLEPGKISRFELLRNAADEVVANVSFARAGETSARFSMDKTGVVEIRPSEKLAGLRLLCPIEYGVAPGFIGDDLIYGPGSQPEAETLAVPADSLFVGLLKGEEAELLLTWPKGKQQLTLRRGPEQNGSRAFESIDFENDGQSLYLAALAAPGVWHREALTSSFLEKDAPIQWKRPFPARWQTQLSEAGVKTTFAFRDAKGTIWRGVPGSYDYPVWFEGEKAFYHLSKKVPPKGESLIYFLEGQETPLSVLTPVEMLKATLGRSASESLLDPAGHKLRTHHRRGSSGVRRACTCGCTEAIQAVFEAGEEVAKKDQISQELADMTYFVERHMARIEEYQRFANDLLQLLQAKGSSAPELKPYFESLEPIARQIREEYDVQKENMKSLDYAGELTRQTLALTAKRDAKNLAAYMELLKAWRGMGGAQDYVVAQCHALTRKLFQEAGYAAATEPKAVELAREIRARCRQCLRNPDGYEIWANY